jgi:hypothetical protein
MTKLTPPSAPRPELLEGTITRREALRRTVVFSTTALVGGRASLLRARAPETKFAQRGIHLLALGDYGSKNDNQAAVARAMANFAKQLDQPLTAVLALGDNFYKKLTPDRFDKHFEQMYSTDGLDCPFYVCIGNHDYGEALYDFQHGKLQMQLDYAKNNPNSRWKLPSKWYSVELPSADKPLVKLIVLDGDYWPGALTPKEKIAQRRFLEAELKKPTDAPWVWHINHFPLFSDCKKRGDSKSLIREWGEMIKDSNISLCFAGHDHNMQHLRVEGYNASFLICGTGGASLYEIKRTNRGFTNDETFGFSHIHVTPEAVNIQFITTKGDCLHHFQRTPTGDVKVLS